MSFGRNNGAGARPITTWLGKGAWAIVDQGLFATSNFAVSILLARWLAPEAYGAFTVAFALFLLISTVHTGFLTEPMLVFGPSRFRDRMPAYLRTLLRGHVGLSVVAGAVLLAAAAVAAWNGASTLATDLVILAVAQPLLLVAWLMRRACYVELQPRLAAIGSGIYAVLVIGGIAFLQFWATLTVGSAFAVMSIAALGASIWIAIRLRISSGSRDPALHREAAGRHWRYGRWAAATGALGWIYVWMSFLILPIFAGLEASAHLRALMNLALPAIHIHGAMTVLLVPVFVQSIREGKFRSTGVIATCAVVAGMVVYWVVLVLFGEALVTLLYGGLYLEYVHLLWLVGAIPVIGALSSIMASLLQAMEQPRLVFWAHAGAALTAATVGLGMIFVLGLLGALLFHIVSEVVNVTIKGTMLKSLGANRTHAPVPVRYPQAEPSYVS